MATATDRPARYAHPVNPGTKAIAPRLQRRTTRSFEGEAPPDRLVIWLCDQGYNIIAKSANPAEFARLARGTSAEGKPAELVVLYWTGSVLVQGAGADTAAALLDSICEPTPVTANLFDSLGDADAQRKEAR